MFCLIVPEHAQRSEIPMQITTGFPVKETNYWWRSLLISPLEKNLMWKFKNDIKKLYYQILIPFTHHIIFCIFRSLQLLWSQLSVCPWQWAWFWGQWFMWSWPGCLDAKQALPRSPAVHLTNHVNQGTLQNSTADTAMTATVTIVWLVRHSCYTTKPPLQITLKQISNLASGAPPSTLYGRAVKSQGRQTRGARCVCHLQQRWPRQMDQFRQEPTRLVLQPDLCHFGAIMACMVSLPSHHLQPMKAFLKLMEKHAPEWMKHQEV